MAFNDPKQLDRESANVRNEMRASAASAARSETRADWLAAGRALAERIESTGVLREPELTHG